MKRLRETVAKYWLEWVLIAALPSGLVGATLLWRSGGAPGTLLFWLGAALMVPPVVYCGFLAFAVGLLVHHAWSERGRERG